jgi:hypothetical protein
VFNLALPPRADHYINRLVPHPLLPGIPGVLLPGALIAYFASEFCGYTFGLFGIEIA